MNKPDHMKPRKLIALFILLILTLPCTYGGCVVIFSSGDTDRDDEITDNDSSGGFIGVTSQAAVTPMNAETLAAGAFTGGRTSVASQNSESNRSSDLIPTNAGRPLRFPLVLADALRRIELDSARILYSETTVINENGEIEGDCGGDFTYELNLNKVSEKFSGNLSFRDYCDDGIRISGETDVDGSFEVSSGAFNTATFSFDSLSDGFHTLDGEIALDFADIPILVSFTAYSTDEHTGQVYWIRDYSLNLFELAGRIEIDIFGTFYHPDYGFVTVSTFDPFIVHDGDDWPASGRLVVDGGNDTRAQLMAIDHLHFGIEAVTGANGIFDWDSGILDWNDSPET
jgi:hypothetical protein